MNDLISRQDAIDAISCNITVIGRQNAELVAATIGTFADRIKALPSAEPERKKGEWIRGCCTSGREYRRCTECHAEIEETFFGFAYCVNYCPNCGARMVGEEE